MAEMSGDLYPLLFQPVLKGYIWGGRTLADRFGRDLPPGVTAESWEIAAHPNGETKVTNGRYAGRSLTELVPELGLALIGSNNRWAQERNKFPLLIKLLDARQPLSVQVHPDDLYARQHAGNELGKSEMWVVLDADPEAAVILGITPGTTTAAFRQGIANGHLIDYLHHIPVQAGDTINVPAGSVHAILGGVVIAEIQQNSDITYRVFDWGRDDPQRPLHIEDSMAVINFDQVAPQPVAPTLSGSGPGWERWQLAQTPYFLVERLRLDAGATYAGVADGRSPEIWGCLTGRARVVAGSGTVDLNAVAFTLLPAAVGPFAITAGEEDALTALRVTTPDSR